MTVVGARNSRVHVVGWWLAVVAIAGILALGVIASSLPVLWTSGVLLTVCLIRLRCGTVLTPAVFPMMVLVVVGDAGYESNGNQVPRAGTSYFTYLSDSVNRATLGLMCATAIAIGLGSLLTLPGPRAHGTALETARIDVPERWLRTLTWAAFVPVVLTFVSIGPGNLLHRDAYLVGAKGGIYSLASGLSVASVVLFGYVFGASRGSRKFVALVGAAAMLLLFFCLGSRRMALWPLLFVGGVALRRQTRRAGIAVLIAIGLAVWLIRVPLYLRGLSTHGFAPYFSHLWPALTANQQGNPTINNIIVSYPITGQVAYVQPPIPGSWLITELNPLPGRLVGFYDISSQLKLNNATPYGTIGELGNHGLTVAVIVAAAVGAVLGYLERRVRWLTSHGRQFIGVVYFSLVGLFSVQILQYQMRASFRPLWYLLAIDIALVALPQLAGLPRSGRAAREG